MSLRPAHILRTTTITVQQKLGCLVLRHADWLTRPAPVTRCRYTAADLRACLEAQGSTENVFTPGEAVLVRTGHGSRFRTEATTFFDGAPGLGLEAAEWLAPKQPARGGRR